MIRIDLLLATCVFVFVLKIKRVTSSLNPRLTRPPFPLLWSGTLVSRLLPPTCFRAPVCSLYSSVTHADAGSSYSLCSALFSSIYRSPLFSLSPLACHLLLLEQLCGPRPSIVCSPSFRLGFSYSGFSLCLRCSRFCGSEESTACSKFKSRGERKRSEPLGFTNSSGFGGGGGYSPVLRRQQSLSKSERGKQVASCKRVHYYSCVGGHVILSSPLSRHPSHPRDHDH